MFGLYFTENPLSITIMLQYVSFKMLLDFTVLFFNHVIEVRDNCPVDVSIVDIAG